MKFIKNEFGFFVPKEKEKKEKPERLKQWNCPHCNTFYDSTKQDAEEATIGSVIGKTYIPHIKCPICEHCMGCSSNSR